VKWNYKGFYTMISILFVALFHWNVERDSSPRHKAIPVLFQVFPLFPLVLCGVYVLGSVCLVTSDDATSEKSWRLFHL
jgi:hypothetical protein